MAKVTGTVTVGGEPLDGVLVKFVPDPATGLVGPTSFAMTSDGGSFDLMHDRKKGLYGAVVGKHIVFLMDPTRENRPPGPRRLRSEYLSPAKSPLSFDIVPGEQEIDIELEKL